MDSYQTGFLSLLNGLFHHSFAVHGALTTIALATISLATIAFAQVIAVARAATEILEVFATTTTAAAAGADEGIEAIT